MNFQLLFTQSFALMTVFIYGCCGEILIEKSGHLNLGIPGIMSLGALGGIMGEIAYLNMLGEANIANINPFLCVFIPIIFSLIFAGIGGLIFSFFTVTLKSNQNVVGLILTTFGVAFSSYILSKKSSIPMFDYLPKAGIYFSSLFFPGRSTQSLNTFESLFLSYGFLTYFAIIVAILLAIFLNKTKIGLNVRAVGENPSSADSCGINVNKYRYISTIVGSAIAGLGGLYILMDKAGGMDATISIEPYGWLAVLLVIFSMWKPAYSILGSFIFSVFMTLPNLLNGSKVLSEVFSMIPYIMTIIILILTSIIKFKDSNAPEGLGQSYFREDR